MKGLILFFGLIFFGFEQKFTMGKQIFSGDLTNNPSRQEEREVRYGNHRSVSVGDIVEVDGVNYLCLPNGWEQI